MGFWRELFCIHQWRKKTILGLCRVRVDCAHCEQPGREVADHSYGAWKQKEEEWERSRYGMKMGTFTVHVQERVCQKCSFLDRIERRSSGGEQW